MLHELLWNKKYSIPENALKSEQRARCGRKDEMWFIFWLSDGYVLPLDC